MCLFVYSYNKISIELNSCTTSASVDSGKEWILFLDCGQIRHNFHLDGRVATFKQVQNVLFHIRRRHILRVTATNVSTGNP